MTRRYTYIRQESTEMVQNRSKMTFDLLIEISFYWAAILLVSSKILLNGQNHFYNWYFTGNDIFGPTFFTSIKGSKENLLKIMRTEKYRSKFDLWPWPFIFDLDPRTKILGKKSYPMEMKRYANFGQKIISQSKSRALFVLFLEKNMEKYNIRGGYLEGWYLESWWKINQTGFG